MRKKIKCYVIKEEKTNLLQGAFPYTDEGKSLAKKYLKKISKHKKCRIEEL
tara:strand:- start:8595 stop:8747 length:153 start_codon:yes stop_codon:yes gene_type:complete